jgi:hypothetical protein
MRFHAFIASLLFAPIVLAGAPAATAPTNQDLGDINTYIREATSPAYLVIVGSSKDFLSLQRQARKITKRTGRRYSMEGMVFDGTLHETGEDDGFTGYFHRRYDSDADGKPYLSIEKSESYPGLKPGLYIIVAGICATSHDAQNETRTLRKFVPDAYAHKTEIYYGCIH